MRKRMPSFQCYGDWKTLSLEVWDRMLSSAEVQTLWRRTKTALSLNVNIEALYTPVDTKRIKITFSDQATFAVGIKEVEVIGAINMHLSPTSDLGCYRIHQNGNCPFSSSNPNPCNNAYCSGATNRKSFPCQYLIYKYCNEYPNDSGCYDNIIYTIQTCDFEQSTSQKE